MPTFRGSVLFSNTDIVFSSDTPKWQYMKKQVMAALKQHGDGLKNLEAKTLFYGNQLLKTIKEYNGKPFEPRGLIRMSIAHIMLILMFGQSSESDAVAFMESQSNIDEIFRPAGAYIILDLAPLLRYFVPPVKKAYRELLDVMISTNCIYDKYIALRRKLYDHSNVHVFMDHFFYLNTMNQADNPLKNINQTDIRSMAIDMFIAGYGTISSTLTMMLAIMVNHPEIQDIVYQEINDVIGTRQPIMEDKLRMPYTQAVILETLRYHSLAPFANPHVAKCDSELQGYLIPAGTLIFPNLWSLHHDPRYWKRPQEFDPNRWLENGKIVSPDHIKDT